MGKTHFSITYPTKSWNHCLEQFVKNVQKMYTMLKMLFHFSFKNMK
jgi:hypothetical protein